MVQIFIFSSNIITIFELSTKFGSSRVIYLSSAVLKIFSKLSKIRCTCSLNKVSIAFLIIINELSKIFRPFWSCVYVITFAYILFKLTFVCTYFRNKFCTISFILMLICITPISLTLPPLNLTAPMHLIKMELAKLFMAM
jgi:hypothetical protein